VRGARDVITTQQQAIREAKRLNKQLFIVVRGKSPRADQYVITDRLDPNERPLYIVSPEGQVKKPL
jgi:hypothetical protein